MFSFIFKMILFLLFSVEARRDLSSASLPPPLSANESLRVYLATNGSARLYGPRPPVFPFLGPRLPGLPHPHGHAHGHHPRLPPPLLPAWPGFPLSGRKRRHRTIFTEGQLREVTGISLGPNVRLVCLSQILSTFDLLTRFPSLQLENTFNTSHYPDVVQRELLAKRINLKEERIEVRAL